MIEDNINSENDVRSLINNMLSTSEILGAFALILIGVGVVVGCFADELTGQTLTHIGVFFMMEVGVLCAISGILTLTLNDLKELESELKVVMDDLADLNSYQHGSPVANNMNLTTKTCEDLNDTLNVSKSDETKLNFKIVTEPQHGTLKLNSNGSFSYKSFDNYLGTDSFTYKVDDGVLESSTAQVTIKITPPIAPVANNMSLIINKGTKLNTTFNVINLFNNNLTFSIVTPPKHGTVKIYHERFVYIAAINYVGIDSFTYKANNGLDSNIATITINIKKINKGGGNISLKDFIDKIE